MHPKNTISRPFKKSLSKREIRQQLLADMDVFLSKGGKVMQVPNGSSGIYNQGGSGGAGFAKHPILLRESKVSRTLVPEMVAVIESRKGHTTLAVKTPKQRKHTRQKKWIYDDFGEPLRWVWRD